MRIQHNIMAMSAYRNYSNNTSALSKNLTKLSSGYKINSAADDAAGLAISEKMRAQITGLDTASKNVKDGISLVQTGEGAMQEIQDMLNRMVELATESANGTYQDAVDRENLQKEVVSLQSEINRIADSANFNGIQLLDGSLASTQKITAAEVSSVEGAQVTAGATEAAKVSVAFVTGTASVNSFTGWASNDTVTLKLGSVTIATAKYTGSAWSITKGADFSGYTITFDGSTFDIAAAGKGAVTTNALTSKADGYTVTTTATSAKSSGTINGVTGYTKGADSAAEVKGKAVVDFDGKTGSKVIGGKLTVGGTTYEFVTATSAASTGATAIVVKADDTAGAIATAFAAKFTNATASGAKVTVEGTDYQKVSASVSTVELTNAGGLTLQIGDTADDFNKITVSVNNMHCDALGIDGVNIGNQDGAAEAISKIKAAINTVSGTRGDLGALQNRLEHTSNNLSVMTENITDAESTIRDVDVAEEMMDYTKNNILIQSAQAMLAQANTVPQGVLQLLQ